MNTLTQRCITLHCLSVDDHGHCSTSVWQDADKRAELSLYLLKEEGLPRKDDELEVNMVFQSDTPDTTQTGNDAPLPLDPVTSTDSTSTSTTASDTTQDTADDSSTTTDASAAVSVQVADAGGVSQAQSGGA